MKEGHFETMTQTGKSNLQKAPLGFLVVSFSSVRKLNCPEIFDYSCHTSSPDNESIMLCGMFFGLVYFVIFTICL